MSWSKHLDSSSKCPEFCNDKVTFINMRFCPYAQRTLLVLEAKNIPFETVNVDLKSKPEWFLKMNPLGKVPTIRQPNGDVFYESLPVCDFLDQVYDCGRSLNPSSPEDKARNHMLLAHFDLAIGFYYKIVFCKSAAERHELSSKFQEKLQVLEQELEKRGSEFFNEGNGLPGMLDYMIWPWMERLDVLPMLYQEMTEMLPKANFPLLNVWISSMKSDKAVQSYILEPEIHFKFTQSYINGTPIYDF